MNQPSFSWASCLLFVCNSRRMCGRTAQTTVHSISQAISQILDGIQQHIVSHVKWRREQTARSSSFQNLPGRRLNLDPRMTWSYLIKSVIRRDLPQGSDPTSAGQMTQHNGTRIACYSQSIKFAAGCLPTHHSPLSIFHTISYCVFCS